MAERMEARLSGDASRHGLVFAGIVLAEAAALIEGRHALQMQAFGPDAQGRASRSDVLLSDEEIDSPEVTQLDALVALTPEALGRYAAQLREGGLLLCDASCAPPAVEGRRLVSLPLLREGDADARLVGLAALGALLELRPMVSPTALQRALADRLTPEELPRFERSVERGRELARSVR